MLSGLCQAFFYFLWARKQDRVARRFQQWQSLHGNDAHMATAVEPSLEGRRNGEKWGRHHLLGVLGGHTVCFLSVVLALCFGTLSSASRDISGAVWEGLSPEHGPKASHPGVERRIGVSLRTR